ncbi:MAG: winged helix-turn-helix domain-containing protein [Fimbriimonadales bacterium]|nr:winged helix-turn-helix domain-containing protein [Fimbriimonadales bacterium]
MRGQTQADIVEQALKKLGGFATLSDLYEHVDTKGWGTQTPHATIRRILQADPQGRFFRIRPGLWGLRQRRQQILRALKIDERATNEEKQQFDHTYYQAILLELGKELDCLTAVASQDKNRRFAGKKLSEIASIKKLPQFTYRDLVNTARSVDVIWFRRYGADHLFPVSFFEVEHTTNFHRSLIKFAEFGFLAAKFCIVASESRQEQFQRALGHEIFHVLRERVEFLSYEELEREYERIRDSKHLRLAKLVGAR